MPFQLDNTKTKLEFSIKHMMIHTVRGVFRECDAELSIDPADLTKSSVTARIHTKSVSTGDRMRDDYLVSKDFFNPEKYPHITFRSTSVRLSGKKLSVTGFLKIRDREQQLILNGTVSANDAKGGNKRLAFDLSGELAREDYGLVFNGAVEAVSLVVGKKVNLTLHIEVAEA